jgi:hypothetical protein
MTVADLAKRCAQLGAQQLTAQALYKLEGQRESKTRRPRPVSVDELLVLSCALDCAPVDLLVPPLPSPHQWDEARQEAVNVSPNDEDTPYPVTPSMHVPCYKARQFIRGDEPLPGMEPLIFIRNRPPQYWPSAEQLKKITGEKESDHR